MTFDGKGNITGTFNSQSVTATYTEGDDGKYTITGFPGGAAGFTPNNGALSTLGYSGTNPYGYNSNANFTKLDGFQGTYTVYGEATKTTIIGEVVFDGKGNITGTFKDNDISWTYTEASDGKYTITGMSDESRFSTNEGLPSVLDYGGVVWGGMYQYNAYFEKVDA